MTIKTVFSALIFVAAAGEFALAASGHEFSRELAKSRGKVEVPPPASFEPDFFEWGRKLSPRAQEFQLLMTNFHNPNLPSGKKLGPNSLCQIMTGEDEQGKFIVGPYFYNARFVDAKGKPAGGAGAYGQRVYRLRLPNQEGSRRLDPAVESSPSLEKASDAGWYRMQRNFVTSDGYGMSIDEYQLSPDLSVSAIRSRVYVGLPSPGAYEGAKPVTEIECEGAGS